MVITIKEFKIKTLEYNSKIRGNLRQGKIKTHVGQNWILTKTD